MSAGGLGPPALVAGFFVVVLLAGDVREVAVQLTRATVTITVTMTTAAARKNGK